MIGFGLIGLGATIALGSIIIYSINLKGERK